MKTMGVLSIALRNMMTKVTTIKIVNTPILNERCFFFMSDRMYEIIIEKEEKNPALVTSTVIACFTGGGSLFWNILPLESSSKELLSLF